MLHVMRGWEKSGKVGNDGEVEKVKSKSFSTLFVSLT